MEEEVVEGARHHEQQSRAAARSAKETAICRALHFLLWKEASKVAQTSLTFQCLARETCSKRADVPSVTEVLKADSHGRFIAFHESIERKLGIVQPIINRNVFYFLRDEQEPEMFISHLRHHGKLQRMMDLFRLKATERMNDDDAGTISSFSLNTFLECLEEYLSFWLVLNSSDAGFTTAVWEHRQPNLMYMVLCLQGPNKSLWAGMCFSDVIGEANIRARAISNLIAANSRLGPFEEANYDVLIELTQSQGGFVYEDHGSAGASGESRTGRPNFGIFFQQPQDERT